MVTGMPGLAVAVDVTPRELDRLMDGVLDAMMAAGVRELEAELVTPRDRLCVSDIDLVGVTGVTDLGALLVLMDMEGVLEGVVALVRVLVFDRLRVAVLDCDPGVRVRDTVLGPLLLLGDGLVPVQEPYPD